MSASGASRAAALLGLALAGLAAASACATRPDDAPLESLEAGRYVMGTVLELSLHGPDPEALARARDEAFALAERLDAMLSTWVESSDLSRVNAAAGGEPVPVDPLTAVLLRRSLELGARTRGAFDVTVGPLVSLWVDAAARDRLPSEAEIAAARALVGPHHVRVSGDDRVAVDPGTRLDLGGVAKGFALDRMLPLLRREGVRSALLSFGQSSVWAFGAPPDAEGWRLLARSPDGGFAGIVTLRDRALSVSGSLGQWSEIEGRRFGHVLDPRSGWPLTHRRQALVVGPDGALTEALSTALLVLGAAEGIAVVEAEPGCEALLLDAAGRRFVTRGFEAATSFEAVAPAQGGAADVRSPGHEARAFLPDL